MFYLLIKYIFFIYNDPYNLDPEREDISIEKKLNKDVFCPFVAMTSGFGIQSDYYSIRTVNPLKETFFHAMQALIFPLQNLFKYQLFYAILLYLYL